MKNELIEIKLKDISTENNSRISYRESEMGELMTSMKQTGLLEPVGVQPNGKGYALVFGFRRYYAAHKLGWKTITSRLISDEKLGDEDTSILNLTENMIRRNPSIAEQFTAFKKLRGAGLSISEIAARLGVSTNKVKAYFREGQRIPQKYLEQIVETGPGPTGARRRGITGSTAMSIAQFYKSGKITAEQRDGLFEWTKKEGSGYREVMIVMKLIRDGLSLQEGIDRANDFRGITIPVSFSKKEMKKLELNTSQDCGDLIRHLIKEAHPKLLLS